MRISFLVILAMIAFASNSLLCRAALRHTSIDPASFTSIRIVSGALILALVLKLRRRPQWRSGHWPSAIALFVYAVAFSFAYVDLSAGTGALLLFMAVQLTMIVTGLWQGERLRFTQWLGLTIALGGLVLLLSPGLTAPSAKGTLLMLSAGAAWGIYSLRGRRNADPIATTAGNFLRAVPLTLLCSLTFLGTTTLDRMGLVYGIISGAITSGLGYVIWYTALPRLKSSVAATVQLSVPLIAALGGIIFLGEFFTTRFAISSVAILGGIALVVLEQRIKLNTPDT
jgi:drug/metabolite transporter (DMT)-like permease